MRKPLSSGQKWFLRPYLYFCARKSKNLPSIIFLSWCMFRTQVATMALHGWVLRWKRECVAKYSIPCCQANCRKSVSRGNRTQICVLELVIGGRVRRAGRGGARGWVAVQRRVGPRLPKGTPPPNSPPPLGQGQGRSLPPPLADSAISFRILIFDF